MSSVIFAIPSNNDHTLILDTRASLLQQFKATNWTDLRLTMALSLTSNGANDQQSGLFEILGSSGDNNHAYIGFKSSDGLLPPSTNFWGFSTEQQALLTSPAQLYDQGGVLWQPGNNNTIVFPALLSNGITKQNNTIGQATGPTFFEGASPATLYASVFCLRMRRNDPTLAQITTAEVALTNAGGTMNLPSGNVSDTSTGNLRALTAAAVFTQILGPFTFSSAPDAIYAYWPFNNSKLRIHNYVVEKYA